MSEEIKDLKDEEVAESKNDLNLDAIKTSDNASEGANVSSAGEMTVKENWFAAKIRKFKKWKTETGIKIDHWSRKKPLRRKLYLNRTLYFVIRKKGNISMIFFISIKGLYKKIISFSLYINSECHISDKNSLKISPILFSLLKFK